MGAKRRNSLFGEESKGSLSSLCEDEGGEVRSVDKCYIVIRVRSSVAREAIFGTKDQAICFKHPLMRMNWTDS